MSAPDPLGEFRAHFDRAAAVAEFDETAAALATADAGGRPSVRMVLLKAVDERGFVFYTNYGSRKAAELEANPRAALCFHWDPIDLQVRIEGAVTRVSAEESDAYFATRPRGSQLGAWASEQSRPLASRFSLLRRYLALQLQYAGREVPRPPHWGGFRLAPERIEFWSSERFRLHDRRLFTRRGDGWEMTRLQP